MVRAAISTHTDFDRLHPQASQVVERALERHGLKNDRKDADLHETE
jgi:hypothetical protein